LRDFLHNPSTIKQWVEAQLFPNRKVALRRAGILEKKERGGIRCVATVLLNEKGGRKENVYCSRQIQHVRHDVMMTQQIIPVWRFVHRTGLDEHFNADAEIRFGEIVIFCEMDMNTENIKRDIVPRMRAYQEAEVYNVWFAPTEDRIEALKRAGGRYSMFSRCGTRVWHDLRGQNSRWTWGVSRSNSTII